MEPIEIESLLRKLEDLGGRLHVWRQDQPHSASGPVREITAATTPSGVKGGQDSSRPTLPGFGNKEDERDLDAA